MPKNFHFLLLPALLIYALGIFASPIRSAAADPISATVSATATVPSGGVNPQDTQAPTIPILISPADGTHSGDNTPEFVWRASTDPDGNTVHYTFYLNGVATFLGISNIGNSSGNGFSSRLDDTEIRLTPTNSIADGSYTWYVTASDPSGHTSQSTTWSFIVDTTPPPLILEDLDTYHLPLITAGASFDIAGPKNVLFTVKSDPFTDIQITLTSLSGTLTKLKATTSASGLAYLDPHLSVDTYTVTILSIDRGGNTTFLPDFTLRITQSQISITLPTSPEPIFTIPYTPITLSSLPATIAELQTRSTLPYLLIGLLAILLLLLLIFLWKRKNNLYLIDSAGNPLSIATVYHSRPRRFVPLSFLTSQSDPLLYSLTINQRGKLYIPQLGRYSTLTIRSGKDTLILSISVSLTHYTIVV
jgi:hypothetical protein